MSFNNDDPEAENQRLAALAEWQQRLEEWREQVRQENERVLQLIQEQFEEDQRAALNNKY